MLRKPEQWAKALSPICMMVAGSCMEATEAHPLKASAGMAVMVEGSSMLASNVQPRKQPCPSVESEVTNWKDCSCEQFSKA
jgi:hypothetical protein